ncbi:5-hydroxytryptamine receptor 3A-like [Limanda limanda]|uniref:5-hydroxytryptamine receptor 3A-like n=1 Tax=Limanda limanda TaxID=27771 RepID=UPI0029C6F1D1|nr:5-hydroxytryptamine receptor 3A-like [Limanda limanda]
MLGGVLFLLLLLPGGASADEQNCSYQDVLDHLNLTQRSKMFYMNRPVKNYKTPTKVYLDLLLYAILEVQEKDQKFVPYVWITMWWKNDFISWDPEEFCGMEFVSIPNELIWKPDITIVEMTERDSAPPSPYVSLTFRGNVEIVNDLVLTSTCRMQIYKFPFDTQSCNLTFKSFIHSDEEIELVRYLNSEEITEDSREVMRIQSEWLFINITVSSITEKPYKHNYTSVIYTINMKRRSALYIVNFILPILFLLCLDLSSFMISDSGGEKLGFKITVLLAITVMQLILNDILPSSSNRIPLIAVYCIGVFSLMMLSLMETVLVMYLIQKDSAPRDGDETEEEGRSLREDKRDSNKQFYSKSKFKFGLQVRSPGKRASEPNVFQEFQNSSSRLMEESHVSERLLYEIKALTLFLKSREEEPKPGYWTRVAQRINKAFCVFYFSCAVLFLIYMFINWNYDLSKEATEESKELMRTQYEWLFNDIKVCSETINSFDVIIYTINMKRRSILYIVNFLLPVLFFLFLDLASFLISDNGGEKLSFKVTVLLANK